MGSKGFTTFGSPTPPSQNRKFFHPRNMVDRILAAWGRPRDNQDSRLSKASDDSELQEWKMDAGKSRRSAQWTERPLSSPQRESVSRYRISIEESSAPLPIPGSLSSDFHDFQFPNQQTPALNVPERSYSPPAANPSFTIPRVPVRSETNVLYATSPDVLYETGPPRSEGPASTLAVPLARALHVDERPLSQPRSTLTGETTASRSISPRRATTTTAATSVSPTFFKRTSDIQLSPARSISPPLWESREGPLSPSARMAGFRLAPASQLEARTVGEAEQGMGTSSGMGEDLFATSVYGAGNGTNAVPGPSRSSSIPFPREPVQVLPVRRPPGREEMTSLEHQAREKERKAMSRRIVQLAMASPGALLSQESFSTDSQADVDMHEGVAPKLSGNLSNEGSHPPVSIRPEQFRKDSLAATSETHQTGFSAKSYPYAGLIALHAPTTRPLSVSSKAKSPNSLGHLSLSASTDYGNPFGHSKQASRAVSFSSSQYLYGYPTANLDGESVRGRSLSRSRRSSSSGLSGDATTSPWRPRNPSLGPSGRAGARASFGPTSKAEAAQRAAALIQLTSGARRNRQVPTRSTTPPP